MNNERIPISDRLIRKQFIHALDVCRKGIDALTDYERGLVHKLSDAYDLFGDSMSVTRKQFNTLRTLAWEIEEGKHG